MSVVDDEATPDREDVLRRLGQAMAYFLRCKPGKRFAPLGAVWLALTGLERGSDAPPLLGHFKVIPPQVRAAVTEAIGAAMPEEPDVGTRCWMVALLERVDAMEAALRAQVKPKRRRVRK